MNTHSRNVMGYVDQIGEDWSRDASGRTQRRGAAAAEAAGTQIRLVLAGNVGERCALSIGATAPLRTLFNEYARERGTSLRSLRFSFRGRTLFLSSAGNKAPEQLDMRDGDVITVHDTGAEQETDSGDNGSNRESAPAFRNAETAENKSRAIRAKCKKKRQDRPTLPVMTLQDWKAQHSDKLSKLHEEAHLRLKEIRTRLNSLDIERQLPKRKRKGKRRGKVKHNVHDLQMLPHPGIGGKAGKSSFHVQVGEAQHLYKTPRRPQPGHRCAAPATLDLHGCTREEALRRLDDALPRWVDDAMRGSYPFVRRATIVCGGGDQVLAGLVARWIRERAQVANARKTLTQ